MWLFPSDMDETVIFRGFFKGKSAGVPPIDGKNGMGAPIKRFSLHILK